MEKAARTSDAITSVRPSVMTLAKFFLQQVHQVLGLTIYALAADHIDEFQVLCVTLASWAGELKKECGARLTATLDQISFFDIFGVVVRHFLVFEREYVENLCSRRSPSKDGQKGMKKTTRRGVAHMQK
ncbi:hypothetical protein R1flu_027645 [Riccia fluitans]|uniref:Uncharacterized protein n=1 Tax=Riccia fluitans TaxID=41844 RepID=A0ABD1XJF5_9MARC